MSVEIENEDVSNFDEVELDEFLANLSDTEDEEFDEALIIKPKENIEKKDSSIPVAQGEIASATFVSSEKEIDDLKESQQIKFKLPGVIQECFNEIDIDVDLEFHLSAKVYNFNEIEIQSIKRMLGIYKSPDVAFLGIDLLKDNLISIQPDIFKKIFTGENLNLLLPRDESFDISAVEEHLSALPEDIDNNFDISVLDLLEHKSFSEFIASEDLFVRSFRIHRLVFPNSNDNLVHILRDLTCSGTKTLPYGGIFFAKFSNMRHNRRRMKLLMTLVAYFDADLGIVLRNSLKDFSDKLRWYSGFFGLCNRLSNRAIRVFVMISTLLGQKSLLSNLTAFSYFFITAEMILIRKSMLSNPKFPMKLAISYISSEKEVLFDNVLKLALFLTSHVSKTMMSIYSELEFEQQTKDIQRESITEDNEVELGNIVDTINIQTISLRENTINTCVLFRRLKTFQTVVIPRLSIVSFGGDNYFVYSGKTTSQGLKKNDIIFSINGLLVRNLDMRQFSSLCWLQSRRKGIVLVVSRACAVEDFNTLKLETLTNHQKLIFRSLCKLYDVSTDEKISKVLNLMNVYQGYELKLFHQVWEKYSYKAKLGDAANFNYMASLISSFLLYVSPSEVLDPSLRVDFVILDVRPLNEIACTGVMPTSFSTMHIGIENLTPEMFGSKKVVLLSSGNSSVVRHFFPALFEKLLRNETAYIEDIARKLIAQGFSQLMVLEGGFHACYQFLRKQNDFVPSNHFVELLDPTHEYSTNTKSVFFSPLMHSNPHYVNILSEYEAQFNFERDIRSDFKTKYYAKCGSMYSDQLSPKNAFRSFSELNFSHSQFYKPNQLLMKLSSTTPKSVQKVVVEKFSDFTMNKMVQDAARQGTYFGDYLTKQFEALNNKMYNEISTFTGTRNQSISFQDEEVSVLVNSLYKGSKTVGPAFGPSATFFNVEKLKPTTEGKEWVKRKLIVACERVITVIILKEESNEGLRIVQVKSNHAFMDIKSFNIHKSDEALCELTLINGKKKRYRMKKAKYFLKLLTENAAAGRNVETSGIAGDIV